MNRNNEENDQNINYKTLLYAITLVTFSMISGWAYWVTNSILSNTETRLENANELYKWQAKVDSTLAEIKGHTSNSLDRISDLEQNIRDLKEHMH